MGLNCRKKRWMDICKNSDCMTQAFLAQVAILLQTITSEFLNWTGRCCLYPIAGSAVLLLLAGNCLPYHQPKLLITKDSKKALGLSRFPLTLPTSPDRSDASDVIQQSPYR